MTDRDSQDRLDETLRAAEREVDECYSSNPLVRLPFADAGWHFLAFSEELAMREVHRQLTGGPSTVQHQAAAAEALVFQAKWPLRWLSQKCVGGGKIPRRFDDAMYAAARELSELSTRYLSFEAAFTHASLGLLELTIDGRTITATGPLRADTRFEAYDRLVKPTGTLSPEAEPFLERVASSVGVREGWFTYDLNPQVVAAGIEALGRAVDHRFVLPEDWAFPRFTLSQFARVAKVLFVLAMIHFHARIAAAVQGCHGLGIARSLMLFEPEELMRRLVRYSGVPYAAVQAIVEDLTYGQRKQTNPDPALQPLVPLTKTVLAIAPHLIINSSLERNLAVLLNRLPRERGAYARLSQGREKLSRESALARLSGLPFRFWHGNVPGWGGASEIDLAIVSDKEQRCLLLELKSFVAPAEPREIRDRSDEIGKGIDQVRERIKAAEIKPSALRSVLRISDGYKMAWAVASETSVGAVHVQCADVPVVNLGHLLKHLAQNETLAESCEWLTTRRYLPVPGAHYEVVQVTRSIGDWTLEWYGIRGLVDTLA